MSEVREPVLPARVDELERVQLQVDLMRIEQMTRQLRQLLAEEEAAQQGVRRRIDDILGPLRVEIDRLKAECERLDARLERLAFHSRSITDDELDREEERQRADEAAWWAEWRHRKASERDVRGEVVHRKNDDDISIRQLYRALARLVHPDLARDSRDRARRETMMRMANAARDGGDVEQLRRLLAIWARDDESELPDALTALQARMAQRRVELGELRRQLAQLRQTPAGQMLRRGEHEVRQYLRHEEVRLRRELAMQRLRRRRVLRMVEERRRELSVHPGD